MQHHRLHASNVLLAHIHLRMVPPLVSNVLLEHIPILVTVQPSTVALHVLLEHIHLRMAHLCVNNVLLAHIPISVIVQPSTIALHVLLDHIHLRMAQLPVCYVTWDILQITPAISNASTVRLVHSATRQDLVRACIAPQDHTAMTQHLNTPTLVP